MSSQQEMCTCTCVSVCCRSACIYMYSAHYLRLRNCKAVQYDTTQHNTTQHNTTQHNTTQHNTTQHNATQNNYNTCKSTQHKTTYPTTPQIMSWTQLHMYRHTYIRIYMYHILMNTHAYTCMYIHVHVLLVHVHMCMYMYMKHTTSEFSFSVKLPNWSSGIRKLTKAGLERSWVLPAMKRSRSSIPFICFLGPDFLSSRGTCRSMAGGRHKGIVVNPLHYHRCPHRLTRITFLVYILYVGGVHFFCILTHTNLYTEAHYNFQCSSVYYCITWTRKTKNTMEDIHVCAYTCTLYISGSWNRTFNVHCKHFLQNTDLQYSSGRRESSSYSTTQHDYTNMHKESLNYNWSKHELQRHSVLCMLHAWLGA